MSKISLVNEDKAHSSIAFTNDGPITSGQTIQLTQAFEIKKDFRARSNDVLLVNTQDNPLTIFLPLDPTDGTTVRIIDGYNTFGVHSVRLDGTDKTVNGDYTFSYLTDGLIIDVIYSPSGWNSSIYYSGSIEEDTPTITSGDDGAYERAVRTLQTYDYDSNGNYIVSGYETRYMHDDGNYHALRVSSGIAHVKGVECVSNSDQRILVRRALDFNSEVNEPLSFTGDGWYKLSWNPIKSITSINGVKQDTTMVLRGQTAGGTDLLPNTPVASIISVRYEASPGVWTTYVAGTHYVKDGTTGIDWLNVAAPAGQPPTGSSYEVTYQYQEEIDTSISADLTQIYVTGLAASSIFYVTYDFYIPRVDRLVLTKEGTLLVVKGNPNALYPSTPVVADHLPLAKISLAYNRDPSIEFDYLRIAKASDIQIMLSRLNHSEYNIARLALHADISVKDPSSKLLHQFVDNFIDEDLKDMGLRNDIAVINDQLELPIDWIQTPARFGDNIHLNYTEHTFISQLAETTTHRVEPYLFEEESLPPPEVIPETFVAVFNSPGVTEGHTGDSKVMVFQIALNRPPTVEPAVFSYRTLETGTATPGDDFVPVAGAITFDVGQSFASISVDVIGDVIDEANNTIQILLTGGKLLGDVIGTGTIIDDDAPAAPYNLTVNSPSVGEGNTGPVSMVFQLMLNRAVTSTAVTINYATLETGTATPNTDFTPVSSSVVLAVGASNATITVPVISDTTFETDETVHVAFTSTAWVGTVTGIGTIVNEDTLPIVDPPIPLPARIRISPKTYSMIDKPIYETITTAVRVHSKNKQQLLADTLAIGGSESDLVLGLWGDWWNKNGLNADGTPNGAKFDAYLKERASEIRSSRDVIGKKIPTTVEIKVVGKNYKSGETVSLYFDNIEVDTALAVEDTPGVEYSGGFTKIFNVPAKQGFGTKLIRAIGRTSNRTAQGVFVASITGEYITRITFRRVDPIAQTFIPEDNTTLTSFEAVFTSEPDVFAIAKLCETTVGFPDDTKVLATAIVEPENIVVDGWTKFTFSDPVLLTANQEYAIILECLDKNVKVKTAAMGQWDRISGRLLQTQPYLNGVLLDSSTSTTWVSYQKEDLTFKLNGGDFSLTKAVTLTTEGVTSPLDTEDGVLYRIDVVDVTDLIVMADTNLPETTQMLFEVTLVNKEKQNVFIVATRVPIQFDSYTGKIRIRALLSTADAALTPTLQGDIYVGLGTVSREAMYTSRAFNCSSGTTIKSYLITYAPPGSDIAMQYMHAGLNLSTNGGGTWTRSSVNTALYYYTGTALERQPERVTINNNQADLVAIGDLTGNDQWAWGDIDVAITAPTVYIKMATDPDASATGYVKADAFYDMTMGTPEAVGYDYYEIPYTATITGKSMTTTQIRIIASTTLATARPIARDLRVLIQDLT